MGTLKKISHLPKVEEMSCSCCCWGPVFTFRKMVRHLKQNVVVSKYISISILVTFIQYIVLYMPIFSWNIHMYFSFFLELFLHWSPVAYWVPADLRSSSFSVLSFCLFILLMGFSRQECWKGLPFPSPVDHVFSELSTMAHPSWVALHGLAHSYWVIQGCGPCDQIGSFSVIVVFSLSVLWWWRIRERLMEW